MNISFFLFISNKMTGTFSFGKHSSDECDGWRDKLVGKVVLNDDEVTTLEDNEVGNVTRFLTNSDFFSQCVRRKDLPRPSRVLPPNSMMTMDYRPDRLNVRVDHTMRVTGVNYG